MDSFESICWTLLITGKCIVTNYPFEMLFLCTGGLLSYYLTVRYIPLAAPSLFDRQLYGIDINKTLPFERAALTEKKGARTYKELTPKERKVFIPESLGIVAGAMYFAALLFLVVVLQVEVIDFSGSIASISVMLLLGFVDDVLNIRWRHKILLSALGSLPLVLAYDRKSFSIVIPSFLSPFFCRLSSPCAHVGDEWVNHSLFGYNNSPTSDAWVDASPFSLPSVSTFSENAWNRSDLTMPSRSSLETEVGRASSFLTSFPFTFCCRSVAHLYHRLRSVLEVQCVSRLPTVVVTGETSSSQSFLRTASFFANCTNMSVSAASFDSPTDSPGSSVCSLFLPKTHFLLYLGPFYLLYLSLLCVFCTNSINILAGVNGVEVGQSIIIAVASVIYNLIQYRLDSSAIVETLKFKNVEPSSTTGSAYIINGSSSSSADPTGRSNHFLVHFSKGELESFATHRLNALIILVPFIGVSLALWRFNRYPSRVFVGDSYTYFAGTVLAVAAISGHYSKTLLLFFIPQLLNFFISLPQLVGYVPCPSHRVPRWNSKTDKLENSGNYTFLNAILLLFGGETGMSEPTLCKVVLGLQVLFCLLGFLIRFGLSSKLYDHVE